MIDRRKLLQWGLGAGLVAPGAAFAAAHGRNRHAHTPHRTGPAHLEPVRYEVLHSEPIVVQPGLSGPRRISLKNLHTLEALDAVYFEDGAYAPDVLEAVNRVLRDFRTGEVHPIEPRLLDVLTDLQARLGSTSPFQVVSGFRSAETNAMLREQSADVAKRSLHLDGKAIDLYLDDVDLDRLHLAALDLSRGGVGYYPQKFIHLDVGPVRHWQGV